MQRAWWGSLVFFGALSVAGMIGGLYATGPEGFWPVVIAAGVLVSVGAFVSGKFLRQRRAALATAITVSADGTLRVVDPEGEAAVSLVGARAVFLHHGQTVDRVYGAEMPSSLGSSGPYGGILIDRDDGRQVLVFAGELPADEQQTLLSAARPFLATGGSVQLASSTPDERYEATSFGKKLREFARMMGTILLLLLPAWAVLVIQAAIRGDLDPNTLWFSIPLVVGGVIVAIVRLVRWRR